MTSGTNRRTTGLLRALVVVTAIGLLPALPVTADPDDLVTIRRAGPIKRDRTTYDQFKNWFGRPQSVDRHPYQCIRVIDAVWRGRFRMFFSTFDEKVVVAMVRDPSVVSDRHGALDFHTRKGLRVGDRASRVRDLYPNADRHHHPNKNLWILVSGDLGRLEATTSNFRVTELRVFPFEAC